MSVSRTLHCDAPDCERHVETTSPPPYVPGFFIETREHKNNGDQVLHFCGWDCAMKYGATLPPEEITPIDECDGAA